MSLQRIDFLIIGAAKCASTSFHHYLNSHPDIFLPKNCGINQETGYFLKPGKESIKGVSNDMIRKDAERIFDEYRGERVVGERSTDYSKYPFRTVDFDGIRSHNPEMKFLYLVGDPSEKLKKLYCHHRLRNPLNTDPDFQAEMAGQASYYEQVFSYHMQVKRYGDIFGWENIRIVNIDGLAGGAGKILSKIFRFLNVRDWPMNIAEKKFNVNPSRPDFGDMQLDAAIGRRLSREFSLLLDLARKRRINIERQES